MSRINGPLILAARKAKKLTLEQVGKALGRSKAYASKLENGPLWPSKEELAAVERLLEIPDGALQANWKDRPWCTRPSSSLFFRSAVKRTLGGQ